MSSIQSPGRRSLTAFFDSKSDADSAASRIRAEGVPDSDIRIVAGDGESLGAEPRTEKKSFWESLSNFFLPSEDRYAYAEGLSRGGYLVSVATNDTNHARILDILDDEGTVDMDEREASWRSEGWAGYQPGQDDLGTQTLGRPASATGGTLGGGVADAGYGARDAAATGATGAANAGLERFGRRDTAENRGRVRSYLSDDDALGGRATGGNPSVVDQAQPVSDQVRRTDIELEDERRETADDVARRTRGAI